MVVMGEYSKSSSYDNGEKRKEYVGDHLVANEKQLKDSI